MTRIRKPNEKLETYTDKFDELKALHKRELKRNSSGTKLDDRALCDLYMDDLHPKVMRQFISQAKPSSLREAKELAVVFS